MNAEIIAVGTELLLGFVLNRDTAILGRALAGIGIHCRRHTTVGDNPQRLREAITAGLERSDIVITCGGLGPTVDDITLETLAWISGKKLVLNKVLLRRIEQHFTRMGRKLPAASRRQAFLPQGATAFPNKVGTAPGILLKLKGVNGCVDERVRKGKTHTQTHKHTHTRFLIALPGPPRELTPILEEQLLPALRKRASAGQILLSRELKTTGLPEPAVDRKVKPLLKLAGKTTVGIYASPGQVLLRITASAPSRKAALKQIAPVERKIRRVLGKRVFAADNETLEGVVVRMLKKKRKTLATAESCTGGLVGHRITEISGSSAVYLGGVVTYANEMKEAALGVPQALLQKQGAVSAPVARQMAEGVRRFTGADYGIGITGIAGPTGGTKRKPVGLVYIALASPRGVQTKRFLFSGTRSIVKFKASQQALDLLRLDLLSLKIHKSSPRKRRSSLARG